MNLKLHETPQRHAPRVHPTLSRAPAAQPHHSQALEWLWSGLTDVPLPGLLDCGPISQTTLDVLIRRQAKIHVADLITPLLDDEARFWEIQGKVRLFRSQELLDQFPAIPADSLSAIFGWHLLDLIPSPAHAALLDRWLSYLHPGGMLFFLLREPRLSQGSDRAWWLEDLKTLGTGAEGRRPFAFPAVTNREVERLVPAGSVKTFLTRSGWREVLVNKPH